MNRWQKNIFKFPKKIKKLFANKKRKIMCGIAGYAQLNLKNEPVSYDHLNAMQKIVAHRGPDGYGIWISKNCTIGLAHRRLSIVDLSAAGAQPMIDQEATVVISFNGEIYNYKALRKELQKLGYRFCSLTDTEVILYAYKAWGIECLHRFEGMFAFALYDILREELFLVRDRIGIKPLYFTIQENYLSFASEIKGLWALPWNEKELNVGAISHYLTLLAIPAPHTIYKNVYKLPASFYAKLDKNKEISFHEWYSPLTATTSFEKQILISEKACIKQVTELLSESIKKRLMADVPLGVFLSGGIDSSLIVALMAQMNSTIKTFTVNFVEDSETADVHWARTIAEKFSTEHYEILISEKEVFNFFTEFVYFQDEPLGDAVCIPMYFAARLFKNNNVTIGLLGEGADELFCGYATYTRYLEYYKYFFLTQKLVPKIVKEGLFNCAQKIMPQNYYYLDIFKNWSENKKMFWGGAIAFPELHKVKIFRDSDFVTHDVITQKIFPGMEESQSSYDVLNYYYKKFTQVTTRSSFYKSLAYLELKHRLPELLLTRFDKMTMAASVEGRVPFLDHKLVEFALKIPQHLLFKNKQTKYILKKVAENFLPHELIYRKKMGFLAPTARWFEKGTYFKPFFLDLLHTKSAAVNNFFYKNALEDLHKKATTSGYAYVHQLWAIQNLLAHELFV